MVNGPQDKFPNNESAYRRLFEASPEAMWVYDLETLRFLAVNDAAISRYGYSRDEFLAMTIQDIRPPEDISALLNNVTQVTQGLDFAGLWQHCLADGRIIFVNITSHTLEFEGRAAEVVLAHDVTELRRQEQSQAQGTAKLQQLNQQLRDREDALITAQRIGNMGSWQLHIASQELTWSDHIFTIFGIPRADFEGSFTAFFKLIHPDDRATFMVQQQAALAGDRPLNIQHRIICPDGQIKIVHERAELVNTPHGQVLSGTVQDVTKRVEAQARVSKSESLLKMAGQVARFGGWSVDLTTQQAEWSEEVCAIHEMSASSPITVPLEASINFYASEYRDRIQTAFTACAEKGIPFNEELQLITAKGKRIWVRSIGEAVRDHSGSIVRVQGAFQDISAQKQVEQALTLSEQRFRQLADALPQIVWTAKSDGTVDYASQTYYSYRGIADTAIDLRAQEWLQGLHPDDVAPCLDTWRKAVNTKSYFYTEYRIRRADGELRWHRVTAQPTHDEDGSLIKWYGSALDIHDLKTAEAAAQDLASRLSLTLESISDGFFTLDREWRFTFVNSEAENLLQQSRAELVGHTMWDKFPEGVNSTAYQEYHQAMETGVSKSFEVFYPPLKAWFDVSAYPSAEGLTVYFRDITQQRAADAQLRLLETAISRINDIVLITEAEPINEPGPKIVFVNNAFERRMGYRPEEVLGRSPRILQGPKTQRDELDRIRTALEQYQPVRAELINYTKTGEAFWLELDITPIADHSGHFTHWVAIERDITDRQQAQEQLAQQAALLDETQDAIIVCDLNNCIYFWNRSAERLYGWAAAEALGQSVQTLIDEGGDTFEQAAGTVRRQGIWNGVMGHRRKDGSTLMAECNWTLVRDAEGTPQAIMAVNTDITERLNLEQKLRQSQRLEAIGQLTGGIAHDFNNLLTVILGNVELLAEQLSAHPNLQLLAETTSSAAQRGADLTHRLLAFARRQALDPNVTQVNSLLAEIDPLLRRTLTANIELELVQGGGLWLCLVDSSQLEAAILNLCLNARDAMPEGGKLTIETANTSLDQAYADQHAEVIPGQYVRIAVTDSGHGIAPEVIGQVFEPFFTTKETGRGTGLGLSMVYGFVKQSGGHIKLYSEVGQGTTAKLYLPRSFQEQESQFSQQDSMTITGGAETILVVEDDDLVRNYVESQLRTLGYEVITARNGGEALQTLYRESEIDLLFTDVMMPGGMNGRQLANAAQQLRPQLKVLYTSGYTENAIVHQGRLDPGVHLLNKPYRLKELADMVRQVLSAGKSV